MVTVEVVEREVVLGGVGGVFRGLAVSLVEEVPVDAPVAHGEHAAEQVVRGVGGEDLRWSQLPRLPHGHEGAVHDAQLLARRAVYVPRHAAFLPFFHFVVFLHRFLNTILSKVTNIYHFPIPWSSGYRFILGEIN